MDTTTFNERYTSIVKKTGTRLCVGLDTDMAWLPEHLLKYDNPLLEFNRQIIEKTDGLCSAYKVNIAFYESIGELGLTALRETLKLIPDDVIVIGDVKRGDIGNTAMRYAESLFDVWEFDAVTVNPYMGTDTIRPYFEKGSGACVFVLALTSNPGSAQFQRIESDGKPVYAHVIDQCMSEFGGDDQLGFVVGATHPEELGRIRKMVGNKTPLLIPGIGAQGGDANGTVKANDGGIAFINVSRGVIKAGSGEDFAEQAARAAQEFRSQLSEADPDPLVNAAASVTS